MASSQQGWEKGGKFKIEATKFQFYTCFVLHGLTHILYHSAELTLTSYNGPIH